MQIEEIFRHIDHTALKADTTWEEMKRLCGEALAYQMASVCIPACYVKRAHEAFPSLNIGTVIGFPLGYGTTDIKAAEARQALKDGASEIDMVINLCDVKNKAYDRVEKEISHIKSVVGEKVLKVIIETCYLTREEKIAMCKAVLNAGADYIKTSTGFGTKGALLEDIRLFKEHACGLKIKAAGGIRSKEEMEAFLNVGCDRIGTSAAMSLRQTAHCDRRGPQTDILELIAEAYEAKNSSYAPYSEFHVGAALLTADGRIYRGCNIENAAYSPTNCAERTAFFKAVSEGALEFSAIAIVGDQEEYLAPCGVCRQVMAEFCDEENFQIVLAKNRAEYKCVPLKELLPEAFSGKNLNGKNKILKK